MRLLLRFRDDLKQRLWAKRPGSSKPARKDQAKRLITKRFNQQIGSERMSEFPQKNRIFLTYPTQGIH
ncbi:hypothetical protein AL058_17415 [Pseudomonas savastanoi pv. nerii]|uniref:Uncharacterized protein n=1 Tax=Pseudomonas savastanoi pv. savastanoi NCPPB 3335 TaxID=693985 RepID=A0ABC8BH68_PSESS|nr:hypothetical protein [Pseudomonas syringae]ARD13469.1 hypothetical protein PSA3335_21890 [Pseudomonas savastanoi pv. savastanoi NCPPB 3335]KWS47959.1 hypothetical protein AL058_17415 [Pseudomonas savastanoi pv. nerii]